MEVKEKHCCSFVSGEYNITPLESIKRFNRAITDLSVNLFEIIWCSTNETKINPRSTNV